MKEFLILVLAWLLWISLSHGQVVNFKEGFQKHNPVSTESTLSIQEKIKIHQDFLDQATRNQDLEKQFYGVLYLFLDQLKALDYPAATRYLLEAETLANTAQNLAWQGMIAHFKGVLSVRMKDNAKAIPYYEQAATLCAQAGDSLCLGESLEQIATMHNSLMDFEQARKYFDLAIPIIEKYGDKGSFATAVNNYGLFHFNQEMYVESIPYFKRAEDIFNKAGRHKEEVQALNNQAAANLELGRFDQAIKIYDQCIRLNTAFNQYDNIITNYSGLANLYEDMGDLAKALEFLNKYYNLRDSLIGAKTQKEIAGLELKYASQQQKLEIQKSQTALVASQYALERLSWIFTVLIISGLFGIWRWRVQSRRVLQERKENEKNLNEMMRVLLEKNSLLAKLEELRSSSEKQDEPSENASDFEENLLNQRILTAADWEGFKRYFEKANPGYLHRLRATYPALSNAEERLFLFIKLNLTNRETAAMLGISVDSVKKTRNRLRHRLELAEETSLEVFIRAF